MTTVLEIDPLNYGNPDAKISYKKQIDSGELSPEVAERAAEIIRSGECLVDITEKDDGCIDGRTAEEVMYLNEEGELVISAVTPDDTHERPKIAGGGYMTSLAMYRSLYGSSSHVDSDLAKTTSILAGKNIYCGAHTGSHSQDDTTDCGANDKVETILQNGIGFRENIGKSVAALLEVAGVKYEDAVFGRVTSGWSTTLENAEYFSGSTGASRLDVINTSVQQAQIESGNDKPLAVTKHLGGDHKEDFIILNYVKGKTFSQAKFREKLSEAFPDIEDINLAQAFVVDVARIIELANAMGETDEEKEIALYAGIAYQLATAATLTDGSLRNFIIK